MFVEGIMSLDQQVQIDLMKAIKDNMSQYINNSKSEDDSNVSMDDCTANVGDENENDVNCTFATMDGISDIDTAPNTPAPKVTKAKQISVQIVEEIDIHGDDNGVSDCQVDNCEGISSSSTNCTLSNPNNSNTNIIKAFDIANITNSDDESADAKEQPLTLSENQNRTIADTQTMVTQVLTCQECDKQKNLIAKLQKDINNSIQR
jgi:hypothetical protein